MAFQPLRKPAPATPKTEALRSTARGVPVEPAHSPLERQAETVARQVAAGHSVPPVKANPTVPGARPARALRPGGEASAPTRTQPAPAPVPAPQPAPAPAPAPRGVQRSPALQPPDGGEPLPEATRRTLEARLGTPLDEVRVHRGTAARQTADELQARAFTTGRDIWLGPGESADDIELMAHEVTHVLQQRDPNVPARVMRNGRREADETPVDPAQLDPLVGRYEPGAGARPGLIRFSQVGAPGFKLAGRRGALWTEQAGGAGLKYRRNYQRGSPDQRNKWRNEIAKDRILEQLRDKEAEAHAGPYEGSTHYFKIGLGSGQQAFYFGTLDDIATEMALPTWTHGSAPQFHSYDVDHTVELQVAYWPQDRSANRMANYELLDSDLNQASGRAIKADIDARVQGFIEASHGALGRSPDQLKDRYDLGFDAATALRGQPASLTRAQYWTREEIEQGLQLRRVEAAGPADIGRAGEARLIGRERGGISKRFTWGGGEAPQPVRDSEADWLRPFVLVDKLFHTDSESVADPAFGTLRLTVPPNDPLWRRIRAPREVDATRIPGARYAGTINKQAVRQALAEELKIKGASPLEVEQFDIENNGILAAGRVASDIPLLRDADIRFSIERGEAQIYKVFEGPEIPLPPPFVLDEMSLVLFASSRRGLGVQGDIALSITGLGRGTISARTSTEGPMQFDGRFDFDTRYFDPARLSFSYNADTGQWSGSGDLGLKPNTLPGIESATGHVEYDGTQLSGNLTVVPRLRALQQGVLAFSHSAAGGSRFAGTLTLSDAVPNVRSGEIETVLTQPPGSDEWRFAARGDLASSFAGFNQRLHVEYDHGGFVVEGGGDFRRGMLSGAVTIGATNYAVDEAGQRGTEPTDTLTAFGSGQVSVALTPWLTATGRIRLLPNGEIELFGELALPPALDVFDERSYQRRLFELNLDIPIIGFAVAGQRVGIFATLGAGLDLSAGIGPGQLRDTRLNVSYNPAHEDQTAIHGQARFVVPAHAGLRMFVRGALGAGIPIVSAELGLEAGGEIGLAGEAAAEAQVDWSPGRGLVLDAMGSIYVQPRFRFDLSGFLEVTADLWVTEIDLYSQRWQLASFEVGSALRFGVEFPLHYEEGRPFELDWDRVRFITPDVDLRQMMDEVIGQVV